MDDNKHISSDGQSLYQLVTAVARALHRFYRSPLFSDYLVVRRRSLMMHPV